MMKRLLFAFVFALLSTSMFAQMSMFCEEPVTHFGGNPESEILLTITNVDASTLKVEIESATPTPVDFLLVNNSSGGVPSGEDFSVPGKISRTLSFPGGAPMFVTLNVLWSFDVPPGTGDPTWQLTSPADPPLMVSFSATCPSQSPFCAAPIADSNNPLPESNALLTIENLDANTIQISVESSTADPVDDIVVPGFPFTPPVNNNGVVSTTVFFANPPAEVNFSEILYSKVNSPGGGAGLWLHRPGAAVPFDAVCGGMTAPAPASAFCAEPVNAFGNDPGSDVFLTIENIDPTTIRISIESADSDPVDDIVIPGQPFSAPVNNNGVVSTTISLPNPPASLDIENILWSKVSAPGGGGGLWQLNAPGSAPISVPFNAVCPPVSAFCATPVLHFGQDPDSEILLTVANIDEFTVFIEIESTNGDPVDNLAVLDLPGGTMLGPVNNAVPGKLSRTIMFAVPPTDFPFQILWSKESAPGGGAGNWQLTAPGAPLTTVPFAAVCPGISAPPPIPAAAFCQERVLHFGQDPASEIIISIVNAGADQFFIEIESANNDPVDLLLVNGGSGAQISGEFVPSPGKIRRMLTYSNGMPAEVSVEILWSKESFGGNWAIAQGPIDVATNGICPPPVPTMGEWGIFLLGLIVLILGTVFMLQFQTASQLKTAGSVNATVPFGASKMPFNRAVFMSALKTTLFLVPLGFAFIYAYWGEIIVDDFFGMLMTIPLVAYLIHLLKK